MATFVQTDLPLPADILRCVFQLAASNDRRTALRLVRVSRVAQGWVDPILYSTVILCREASSHSFLRMAMTSPSKPRSFFAANVTSLSISQAAHNDCIQHILSVCTNVVNLTFWAVPMSNRHTNSLSSQSRAVGSHSNTEIMPVFGSGPRLFLSPQNQSNNNVHSFPDSCFSRIRPKRLVVLFRDSSQQNDSPDLRLRFYDSVTHLSILNRWDEWTTWDDFHHLPSLTHIALDLNMARDVAFPGEENAMIQLGADRIRRVSNTLFNILHHCAHLRVCVVVLLFDDQPARTVLQITQSVLFEMRFHSTQTQRARGDATSRIDPRIIFVQKRQPFLGREAHSAGEQAMWNMAEAGVARQAMGDSTPVLLRVN